ncbi:hypothetical protein ES705_47147 [subsurface metagenome]
MFASVSRVGDGKESRDQVAGWGCLRQLDGGDTHERVIDRGDRLVGVERDLELTLSCCGEAFLGIVELAAEGDNEAVGYMLISGIEWIQGQAAGAEQVEIKQGQVLGFEVDDLDAGMPDSDKVEESEDFGHSCFVFEGVAFDGEDQVADGIDGQVVSLDLGRHRVSVENGAADEFCHWGRSSVKTF